MITRTMKVILSHKNEGHPLGITKDRARRWICPDLHGIYLWVSLIADNKILLILILCNVMLKIALIDHYHHVVPLFKFPCSCFMIIFLSVWCRTSHTWHMDWCIPAGYVLFSKIFIISSFYFIFSAKMLS